MPPRAKKEISQSDKEQFLADMVVKAAYSFSHLDLALEDIGVPPLSADKRTCSGHSWKDFCVTCRFNFCWKCGAGGGETVLHRTKPIATCWTGLCAGTHNEAMNPSREHHGRVLELAKQAMPEKASDEPVAKDRASKVPRIQVAPSLPVAKASIAPAAKASAAPRQMIAPQINIAIAPLAEVSVESTDTDVRRIANGVLGNARFEVTVTVVLEQVMGQMGSSARQG